MLSATLHLRIRRSRSGQNVGIEAFVAGKARCIYHGELLMVTLVAPSPMQSSLCTSQDFSARFRIAVAEDQPRLLEAIVATLARDFEVIATAADGQTLLQRILEKQPDVVVVDLGLPNMNGLEITRQVVQTLRDTRVVICSVEND